MQDMESEHTRAVSNELARVAVGLRHLSREVDSQCGKLDQIASGAFGHDPRRGPLEPERRPARGAPAEDPTRSPELLQGNLNVSLHLIEEKEGAIRLKDGERSEAGLFLEVIRQKWDGFNAEQVSIILSNPFRGSGPVYFKDLLPVVEGFGSLPLGDEGKTQVIEPGQALIYIGMFGRDADRLWAGEQYPRWAVLDWVPPMMKQWAHASWSAPRLGGLWARMWAPNGAQVGGQGVCHEGLFRDDWATGCPEGWVARRVEMVTAVHRSRDWCLNDAGEPLEEPENTFLVPWITRKGYERRGSRSLDGRCEYEAEMLTWSNIDHQHDPRAWRAAAALAPYDLLARRILRQRYSQARVSYGIMGCRDYEFDKDGDPLRWPLWYAVQHYPEGGGCPEAGRAFVHVVGLWNEVRRYFPEVRGDGLEWISAIRHFADPQTGMLMWKPDGHIGWAKAEGLDGKAFMVREAQLAAKVLSEIGLEDIARKMARTLGPWPSIAVAWPGQEDGVGGISPDLGFSTHGLRRALPTSKYSSLDHLNHAASTRDPNGSAQVMDYVRREDRVQYLLPLGSV